MKFGLKILLIAVQQPFLSILYKTFEWCVFLLMKKAFRLKPELNFLNMRVLLFVTPSHQYPLGMPMSLARRTALLAWAKQQNAWIIEDDYDSELRYNGQPFPSLQGMAPDQVIYLGTFSKSYFHRLGLAMQCCLKNW